MSQLIGFGTAAIGRPQYINIRKQIQRPFDLMKFKKMGKAVLEQAYRNGIRYFDTAPGYGLAEELLIEWVREKMDTTIEVATKWGYTYIANFDEHAQLHEVKEHSLPKLNEQWSVSRGLLPYLSSYQIHSATMDTGVLHNKAILERLAELKSDHDLLIGLTTTGADQLAILQKALEIEINGSPLFDVFQVTFNIFDQSLMGIPKDLISRGGRLIIKEALANGRIFPNNNYPHYQSAYMYLQGLANKYDVGIDAIAMRYCIEILSPFKVLSGASDPQQIVENMKTLQFKLSMEEISLLKKLKVPPELYWSERKRLVWN